MKYIISTKRFAFLAILTLIVFSIASPSFAQSSNTYKRGVLIEEPTGQWCGHCPLGAWYMDSLEKLMGDKAVVISWHNSDDMENPESIEFHQNFGINSWPGYVLLRYYKGGYGYVDDQASGKRWVNFSIGSDPAKSAIAFSKSAPVVDFKIVNVAYSPGTRTLDFDLDITPFDTKTMRTEDTTQYVVLAFLTEDDVSMYQHNYGYDGYANPSDIDPFYHQNVGRKGISKVMGDNISLDLANTSAHYPVRQHYTTTVDGAWNDAKINLKTAIVAVAPKTKTPKMNNVLDAAASKYIATYSDVAPDAVWIVLPNANSTTKPGVATNIVWASGGLNEATNVKLEYSVDNGTTWNQIVASTSQSPYPWTIPAEAYGKMAKIRASNASLPNINGISDAFPTPGVIHVTKPTAGEVIDGGTTHDITFTCGNVTNFKKVEYSIDNKATWNQVINISNTNESVTTPWSVPNVNAASAYVRVSDNNGVVGMSEAFSIKAGAGAATISDVTVDNVTNGNLETNKQTTIHWTTTGTISGNLVVEYSKNGGVNWEATPIATVTSEKTSATWTPDFNVLHAAVRVRTTDGATTASSPVFSVGVNGITQVTIDELNASKQAIVNTPLTIKWNKSGEIGTNIIVEYSKTGGSWTTLEDQLLADATSYSWTPTATAPTAYIRVRGNESAASSSQILFSIVNEAGVSSAVSEKGYSLTNYPNPIANFTNISFVMAEHGNVTIEVRDELGRLVGEIANSQFDAGENTVTFDASNLAAGVYTCTFEANGVRLVKKMSVTK